MASNFYSQYRRLPLVTEVKEYIEIMSQKGDSFTPEPLPRNNSNQPPPPPPPPTHTVENNQDKKLENMTAKTLKTAAEMYIFLNTCPGTEATRYWFQTWYHFYEKLFHNESPSKVILTLNPI